MPRRVPLLAILAALFAFATAPALAAPTARAAPVLSGVGQHPPPPGATAQPAAFLGGDNTNPSSTVNSAWTMPASSMLLPCSTVVATCASNGNARGSWTVVLWLQSPDAIPLLVTSSQTWSIFSRCATGSACSGGTDRLLNVRGPQQASPVNELQLAGKSGTLWTPTGAGGGAHTGIVLGTPKHDYCVLISQYGADSGTDGFVSVLVMDASGVVGQNLSSATNSDSTAAGFYYSAAATPRTQASVGQLFDTLGSAYGGSTTAYQKGGAGAYGLVSMLWGVFPNTAGAPDQTVAAKLCGGTNDFKTVVTANSLTLHYLARPDTAGVMKADAAGTITTDPTVLGPVTPTPAAPIFPPSCLVIDDPGQPEVYGVEPGLSGAGATGTVEIDGTFSKAACGFNAAKAQVRVINLSDGAAVTGWKDVPIVSGVFHAQVASVPASAAYPYAKQARLKNSPATLYTLRSPFGVGNNVQIWTQSQGCRLFTVTTGSALVIASENVSFDFLQVLDTDVSNTTAAHPFLYQLKSYGTPTGANNTIGDGALSLAKNLYSASGWATKLTGMCRSGTSADNWTYDFVPVSQALTASGSNTVFSGPGASNFLTPGFPAVTSQDGGGTATPSTLVGHGILHGSLTLKDGNGLQIAHDDGAGNMVGDNGKTVNSATIVYQRNTGSAASGLENPTFTATFSAAQATPVTAFWTNTQEVAAAGGAKTAYGGYGMFGNGSDPTTGHVTNVAWRNKARVTADVVEQCTDNANEVSSQFGAATAGMGSLRAKWDNTILTKPAGWWWRNPATPVVALDYPRDTTIGFSSAAGCHQFFQDYAGLGATTRSSQFKWGGGYWDMAVDCSSATSNVCGPHEDVSIFGGQRMGRRIAAAVWKVQQGLSVTDPTIHDAAFGSDKAHITITFTLPQGSSIASCGTNLSGGTTPPTGVCNFTTANGTVTKGFRIGCCNATASSATYYAMDGLREDQSPAVFDTTGEGFDCSIASATTVSCIKRSGVWISGQTWLQYMAGGPFNRAGGVTAYTITNGGSGYTASASSTVTVTCAGATTTPQVLLKTNSSGVITQALPSRLGVACPSTVTPTVTISGLGAGSGGAVSATRYDTANDNDDVGTGLYDNGGGFGSSGAAGGSEPGWPVRPVVIPIAVSG